MSRDIKSISPDENGEEALKMLMHSGSSGLPVIDRNRRVLGVFTEKEILKTILPIYVKDVGAFSYVGSSKSQLNKLAHLGRFRVIDIMRQEVPTVNEDASLTEVSHIMLARNERRVVVTKDGKATGVITRFDVVKALAKEAGIIK
jgi:CBS domain-containing protein